jgi:hypothetical protein
MGLNLSNRQIAQELSLNENDAQEMTTQLRERLTAKTPPVVLSGEVEIDEVYVVAGHKGNPAAVEKRPQGPTQQNEKRPILGMIQRGGQVVLKMLANVQQTTIKPIIEAGAANGALIHTDEYDIYARLPAWGYEHKTVCDGRGEYARDQGGDGFHEIHVNTMEGFWSLLRSWFGHIAAAAKKSCRSISPFSSSCTTPENMEKRC